MLNRVEIIGRLGRDVEFRTMNNGGDVASFSLAVSEKYKDRNGERQDQALLRGVFKTSLDLARLVVA